MLVRTLFLLIFLAPISQWMSAQNDEDYVNDKVLKYDDYVYRPTIRTVQFHEKSWEIAPAAIALNSSEQLELSFDDLDAEQQQFSFGIIHCNADWTPSDLMPSEYLNGFHDTYILNFAYSLNTLQKYVHYNIIFPQPNQLQFRLSGNYLLYVYANGNKRDLVLSRRFIVYDNKVSVAANFRQPIGGADQFEKQHMDFNITATGYDLTNPYRDMKVVITQNNRWDNSVNDIKPTFVQGNQLLYSLDKASTFNGGNEFRYFDMRSLRFLTERVQEIYRDKDLKTHVVLHKDENRRIKPYLYYSDFNGNFVIRNRETYGNPDTEADYVQVEFFMPYPTAESAGNFYVLGKLTDWRMNKRSKMTYDYERNGYKANLYLKQGFYNYIYVLSNDEKKSGDETVVEGSHWDTENDYAIYVYHRKFGTYYDQLVGYARVNSLKAR